MRRKDREITDKNKIKEIISACSCCRIGFNDNDKVYIVPLNFGFVDDGESYTFYFHGAKEGRKIDLISQNPNVGFEMDANYFLKEADIACAYSARFQSVIGTGTVSILNNFEDKKKGLLAIMEHNTNRANWQFSDEMINSVCVFRLKVETLSCKEHL